VRARQHGLQRRQARQYRRSIRCAPLTARSRRGKISQNEYQLGHGGGIVAIMRLALDTDSRVNLIRSYGAGEIMIGTQRIVHPCIVAPSKLVLDWTVSSFEALSDAPLEPAQLASQLEPLLLAGTGIVLLGSGLLQPFPSTRLRAAFRERGIALECMTLGAACRTYNILATEERSVIAGLFP
jgi:uncharacterized protein